MKNDAGTEGFLITETETGVKFSIHVQPKASRNEVRGVSGNELKVRLTSPPVEGAANRLCRDFLARLFHVSKSDVQIITGEKSRHKTVLIQGITRETVHTLIERCQNGAHE